MAAKPIIKIGHLKLTDHLILGLTHHRLSTGEEKLQYSELQTIPFVGWNQVGSALRAGEIDAAFILAPFAMELFYAGVKLQMVLYGHRTGSVIITNKRAHIRRLEDFRGKTVILPLSLSVHHMLFHKLLAEKGLTIGAGKDVRFEVEAPSQMPQIIEWDEDGTVGGFIVAEPYGTQAVKAGYGEEFKLSQEIWPDHPCCVFVIKQELIGKYPDAVAELTASFVKSGNFAAHNKEATVPIAMTFLDQPEDVVRAILTQPPERVRTDRLYPTLEELDTIQTYMTTKVQAMSAKIDLEKFVNPVFAKAAGAK